MVSVTYSLCALGVAQDNVPLAASSLRTGWMSSRSTTPNTLLFLCAFPEEQLCPLLLGCALPGPGRLLQGWKWEEVCQGRSLHMGVQEGGARPLWCWLFACGLDPCSTPASKRGKAVSWVGFHIPLRPWTQEEQNLPQDDYYHFFVKGVKIATKFLVLPRGFRGHLQHKIQMFEVGFHWSCMCVSKISRCLDICLTKKLVLCELSPIPQIWFPRRTSYLLILRTNYEAFLFSQESHPLRINIAFSEHISWLRTSAVGISYCGAVVCPAGLLLPDCTGEKREKSLRLAEMLCPNYYSSGRSHGPP